MNEVRHFFSRAFGSVLCDIYVSQDELAYIIMADKPAAEKKTSDRQHTRTSILKWTNEYALCAPFSICIVLFNFFFLP